MNIWLVEWYEPVLVEANKLWFYAICISLARSVIQLSAQPDKTAKEKTHGAKPKNKGKESSASSIPSQSALFRRLLVDSCDLTLPASCVGWLEIGNMGIGIAMVVSTVLPLLDLWTALR